MEAATDTVKTGMTAARCMAYVKENRVEMLVVSLLLYSVGALDKAITYGTGICM